MEKVAGAAMVVLIILLLSLCASQTSANAQAEALNRILQTKLLKTKTGLIDTSNFDGRHLIRFDEASLAHDEPNQAGLKDHDEIERLPGQPPVKFKQYGGYVPVDRVAGRALYYYFLEADHHSQKQLPLLLWLNGGPGCSSVGYGAMQELGPFRVHSDGKTLYKNPFAWNHAANVLFLESPAGVGFSYSNKTEDYVTGDKRTVIDNYVFLLNWLERFPEYKNTDFYISGESYAGHYVPQLAHTIFSYNAKANTTKINLKGIIIGNALIDENGESVLVMLKYYGSHALISDDTTDQLVKDCNISSGDKTQLDICEKALSKLKLGNINTYNIYAPVCLNSTLTNKPKKASVRTFDPCIENYVLAYLNRLEVQKALHAAVNVTTIPYKWQHCSEGVNKQWQDWASTVVPLLKELISNGIRVWIYSGDTDGNIPVSSTQHSIKQMKLPIKISWYPWYHLGGQVGGYTRVYEGNFTFATVKGAGHEVPTYQPAAALTLIQHFLAGRDLPSYNKFS